jgi:transglutaminase-like putative cysteine protease
MRSGLLDSSPTVESGEKAWLAVDRPQPGETALRDGARAVERVVQVESIAPPAAGFRLAPAEGWLALGLLGLALYALVIAIIDAHWVEETGVLLWSAPAGLIAGFLVAKGHWLPRPLLHLLAVLAGYGLAFWLTADPGLHVSGMALLEDLQAVLTGRDFSTLASQHVFLLYLVFLCFFLGYLGSWLTYRAHLPWLVALTYCVIMLLNLNYGRGSSLQLLLLLLAALAILIARLHLAALLEDWRGRGLSAERFWLRTLAGRWLALSSLLLLPVLLLSWLLPSMAQPAWGDALWKQVDTALSNLVHQSLLQNASVSPSLQAPTIFFAERLTVSGSVHLPAGLVLEYSGSSAPHYLEGLTYDQFDGRSWAAGDEVEGEAFAAGQRLPSSIPDKRVTLVTSTVTIRQALPGAKYYLFAPAEPASFSVPVIVYGGSLASAWVQEQPLRPGERYSVVSALPHFGVGDLEQVPLLIRDPLFWQSDPRLATLSKDYLQLPPGLPAGILQTAQSWTGNAHNAYQAMLLLASHLGDPHHFSYSLNNPAIPANVDVVSWLLQMHSGYCTYYATAMVVMARMLGMPARLVVGFTQGHFDARRQVWVVNGSDLHSWVQVYFTGYGWINFDPTPGFGSGPGMNANIAGTPTPIAVSSTGPGALPPGTRNTSPTTAPDVSWNISRPQPDLTGPVALLWTLLLAPVGMLLLACSLYLYRRRRRTPTASPVVILYRRLCRLADRAGFKARAWQTPYEYSRILSRAMPQAARPLRRLTDLFVRECWAPPADLPRPWEVQEARRLWPPLRRQLWQRWLRRLLPG